MAGRSGRPAPPHEAGPGWGRNSRVPPSAGTSPLGNRPAAPPSGGARTTPTAMGRSGLPACPGVVERSGRPAAPVAQSPAPTMGVHSQEPVGSREEMRSEAPERSKTPVVRAPSLAPERLGAALRAPPGQIPRWFGRVKESGLRGPPQPEGVPPGRAAEREGSSHLLEGLVHHRAAVPSSSTPGAAVDSPGWP